jgi:hypothetical protein
VAKGDRASGRHARDSSERRQVVFRNCTFRGDEQGRGAIIDPGSIASRDRAVLPEERRQRGELFECSCSRMLVALD